MPDVGQFLHSSPVLGFAVTFGNLAIWLGLACAVLTVGFYWTAMLRELRHRRAAQETAEEETTPRKNGGRRQTAGMGGPLSADELKTALITGWGRRFFCFTCACVIVGVVCLWTLVF